MQFHSEVRAADLGGWLRLPGYLSLFERAGGQQAVARDLQRVTPALDVLAEQLLARWLDLVFHVAEVDSRRVAV